MHNVLLALATPSDGLEAEVVSMPKFWPQCRLRKVGFGLGLKLLASVSRSGVGISYT